MINIVSAKLSKELYDKCFLQQLQFLPSSFIKRITKYKNWQDAQASLFGRLLLKHSLRKYHAYDLDYGSIRLNGYGKPMVPGLNIGFNISHSSNLICCATNNQGNIGIDLEKIDDQINIKDFYCQFTNYESLKIFESNNKTIDFFNYWTQKEAVTKLIGKGLLIPLKSFEIINFKTSIEQKTIYTREVHIHEKYVCHIASEMDLNTVNLTVESIPNFKLSYF